MSSVAYSIYQVAVVLLIAAGTSAWPAPSQRFYYQISGSPSQQADPYAAALLSHRHALQALAQGGLRRPGVYLIPQDNGQEGQGGSSGGGGYVDSFLGLLGSYWPGSVGQPAGSEQKPSGESENSVDEKPAASSAAAPAIVMGSPSASASSMKAPTAAVASVMGSPTTAIMGSPAAASSFMSSPMMMAAPAVRTPEFRPQPSAMQDAAIDDERPADFQGLLAAARLKAAQAAIRAALAAQRGAAAAADDGSQDTQTVDRGDEEQKGPSIAQAKPQAVSVAGIGGVAAAAPIGTAVVGPGGMALAAPQATAVAGAQRRRPSDSDSSDSRIRLSSRIRPDAPAPPFYLY